MITNYGKPGHIGAPHVIAIKHELADEISYFEEPSSAKHCEAAFFLDDEWESKLFLNLQSMQSQ